MHLNKFTSTLPKIKTTKLCMKIITFFFPSTSGEQGNKEWGKFNCYFWYAVLEVRELAT
jgi:hypothetical protein